MAATLRPPLIALLSDFGTTTWYVASMKAVILGLCPRAQLIDITHEIPPQDLTVGAFSLAAAAPWFPPKTVFACVVDPGVGTTRPLIAAQADHQVFVGPDNGLLSLVFQRARHLSLVRVTNPRYWLPEVSRTFHGRDIIAPVAARVACGLPLRRLGMPLARYHRLRVPSLQRAARTVRGCVLLSDPFGNLITNIPATLVPPSATCWVDYRRRRVRLVSSYEEGRREEVVALVGSSGYLELAVREGSAAKRSRARQGDRVELRWQ